MATNERPSRLVVGLGIATVVLFSANLLAMLSQRVWPQVHEALFASQQHTEAGVPEIIVDEVTPGTVLEITAPHLSSSETLHFVHPMSNHNVYTVFSRRRHRQCRGLRHVHTDLISGDELGFDADELERTIERELNRLDGDMSDAEHNLTDAMKFSVRIRGLNDIVSHREVNLSLLENKLEAMSKHFEIKVREHEAASEAHEAASPAAEKAATKAAVSINHERIVIGDRTEN